MEFKMECIHYGKLKFISFMQYIITAEETLMQRYIFTKI